MSDTSQGPGWWQASDGKWYPPEQAPGYQPPVGGAAPGTPGTVDVAAAFQWTWAKYQANLQPLLILGAVVGGVPFLIGLFGLFVSGFVLSTFFLLLGIAAGIILSLLTVQAGLEVANTGTLNQQEMFKIKANFGNFFIGGLIFFALSLVGCLLFCVGLFFVYIIFGLWSFAVVDENKGAVEALTRSKDLIMGPGLGTTILPMIIFLLFNAGSGFVAYGNRFGGLVGVFLAPFGAVLGAYIFKGFKGEAVAP